MIERRTVPVLRQTCTQTIRILSVTLRDHLLDNHPPVICSTPLTSHPSTFCNGSINEYVNHCDSL